MTLRPTIRRLAQVPIPEPADGRTIATAKSRPKRNPVVERSRRVKRRVKA